VIFLKKQQQQTQQQSSNSLTQKETSLLNDAKQHEQLCIDKYGELSSKASNEELSQLFSQIQSQEKNHLKTINQILKTGVYSGGSGSQAQGGQGSQMSANSASSGRAVPNKAGAKSARSAGMTKTASKSSSKSMSASKSAAKTSGASGAKSGAKSAGKAGGILSQMKYDGDFKKDKYLCQDGLTMEKYVSGIYDTAIFEFTNSQNREALNYIQKQEQQHGEWIYNFMAQNGMYEAQ